MKHLQDIIRDDVKSLYESIFDMDEKKGDYEALKYNVETETGYTLSSDGKYILSGTMHFPPEIDITPIRSRGRYNIDWMERLVNCSIKHNLTIQPLGELTMTNSHLNLITPPTKIEYINKLTMHCYGDVDLSPLTTDINYLYISTAGLVANVKVVPTEHYLHTVCVPNSSSPDIKGWNCENLIIDEAVHRIIDPSNGNKEMTTHGKNLLQNIIDDNPKVKNFYIRCWSGRYEKYFSVKLKGRKAEGLMGKTKNNLTTKGVLEDSYQKNSDYKQWYEKHM
jgi:hypothetical protein